MSFVAIGTAVSVASLGMGIASAAGAFTPSVNQPNTTQDALDMQNAQAVLLPEQLRMQAEAQEGGTVLNPGYTAAGSSDTYRAGLQNQIQQAQAQLATINKQIKDQKEKTFWSMGVDNTRFLNQQANQIQSQIQGLQGQLSSIPAGTTVYKDSKGNVVPQSVAETNFAGYGQADIQGQIQKQLAEGQLANAQKYDSQFIAEQLAQEQQANPQGVAARSAIYNDIQKQINNTPKSPVADTMQEQIQGRVNAGGGLTPEEQAVLNEAVNSSGASNQPDLSGGLTSGFAGQERALKNAGSGAAWLGSGDTPQDIQYRSDQQNLSNLSNYISGKTPESQFSQLSGAQSGPTPNTSTNYLPSYNGEAAANMGAQAGADRYGQQVQQSLNTANPWTSSLSLALKAAPVVNQAYNQGTF